MNDADYDELRQRRKHGNRYNRHRNKLKIIAGVVVILIAVFLFYFFGASKINVGASYTGKLDSTGGVYIINGHDYVITMASYNKNLADGYIYLTESPVFLNPTLNVTLPLGQPVKVNYNSSYSTMQFILENATSTSLDLQIMPLSPSLQITPDSQFVKTASYSVIGGSGSTGTTGSTATTTIASTTTISGGSSSTSATTSSTTTVPATNSTSEQISAILARDNYYGLMLNFSKLYQATASCTSSLYNQTFVDHNGYLPKGPPDYVNVSQLTPYNLSQKITYAGKGNYNDTFTTLAQSSQFNNIVALTITVNISTNLAVSNKVNPNGVYQGLNSYSDLSTAYTETDSVGNACAALIG